jgi:hypothetical protein
VTKPSASLTVRAVRVPGVPDVLVPRPRFAAASFRVAGVARLARLVLPLAVVVGATGAGLVACGHARTFDDGVFRKGAVAVRVGPVPAGWRPLRVDGADLAFRDDERSGSVLFDVRCGRDDDAPLSVLTDHLIMGTTEREFDAQDTVPFDRREALHTLLRAKLDGVPMHYDIYVMKRDGCVYDLVYVAPPARFAEGAADVEHFATGLESVGSALATETPPRMPPVSRDP